MTWTPPQVADRLGVSPEKILAFVRAGELAAVNLASPGSTRARWRISEEALAEFLSRRVAKPENKRLRQKRREPYHSYV